MDSFKDSRLFYDSLAAFIKDYQLEKKLIKISISKDELEYIPKVLMILEQNNEMLLKTNIIFDITGLIDFS